jgi:hypothetical protein
MSEGRIYELFALNSDGTESVSRYEIPLDDLLIFSNSIVSEVLLHTDQPSTSTTTTNIAAESHGTETETPTTTLIESMEEEPPQQQEEADYCPCPCGCGGDYMQEKEDDGFEYMEAAEIEGLQSDEVCAICLDEFSIEGVAAAARVIRMPCSHIYHEDCIVEWLENSNMCPMCRYELP